MSARLCNNLSIILLCALPACALIGAPGCRKNPAKGRPQVRIGSMIWDVDLAVNDEQRYKGLSGRNYIDKSVGMLFIYPDSAHRAYCMRGCRVPIDIAFIDSDFRIVKIHTMYVEPGWAGNYSYTSGKPAQYVFEVRGGQFAQSGIRVGDKVTFLGNIPHPTKASPGP